jgi:hypothetical protein
MNRIRLSYPHKLHEVDDLRPLFEEFKATYPLIAEKWRDLEANNEVSLDNNLAFASAKVREFLKERVDYDTPSALIGAFVDFRRLMARDIFRR